MCTQKLKVKSLPRSCQEYEMKCLRRQQLIFFRMQAALLLEHGVALNSENTLYGLSVSVRYRDVGPAVIVWLPS